MDEISSTATVIASKISTTFILGLQKGVRIVNFSFDNSNKEERITASFPNLPT